MGGGGRGGWNRDRYKKNDFYTRSTSFKIWLAFTNFEIMISSKNHMSKVLDKQQRVPVLV